MLQPAIEWYATCVYSSRNDADVLCYMHVMCWWCWIAYGFAHVGTDFIVQLVNNVTTDTFNNDNYFRFFLLLLFFLMLFYVISGDHFHLFAILRTSYYLVLYLLLMQCHCIHVSLTMCSSLDCWSDCHWVNTFAGHISIRNSLKFYSRSMCIKDQPFADLNKHMQPGCVFMWIFKLHAMCVPSHIFLLYHHPPPPQSHPRFLPIFSINCESSAISKMQSQCNETKSDK